MISDRDQRAFLEFARPPAGMRLTYCVGTTFTLDFSVLVQLALATQGDTGAEEKLDIADAYKKLYEFESRSIVFCQACRIQKIPKEFFQPKKTPRQRLLSLLDSAIIAITTSDIDGTFHPKVWLLRFDPIEGRNDPIWKLLVTSRNLTEASTWEIGAELLGRRVGRGGRGNAPLAEFLKKLPKGRGQHAKVKRIIDEAIEDLSAVEFHTPGSFRQWEFISKSGARSCFRIIDNKLYKKIIAVSPFLAKGALNELAKTPDAILITHVKDVALLKSLPKLKSRSYLFKLEGLELHAKAYLCLRSDGNGTDVFLGSANLTNAGMLKGGHNTEAMVRLYSKQDLVADFERKFVFENKARRQPYPWLFPLNDDDFVRSTAIVEEEKKTKILEKVRADLSDGTFVLKRTGRMKWNVTWYGPAIKLDRGICATVWFSDGETAYNLRYLLEGKTKIDIYCKTPSTFLRVKVKMRKVGEIEFGSVAEVIGGSRRRSDDVLREITRHTELAVMLKSILRESANGIATTSGWRNEGDGSRGIRKRKSAVRIEGYVEALLLADLNSQSQRMLITNTLRSYVKAGNAQALALQKFWNELKSVIQASDAHAP